MKLVNIDYVPGYEIVEALGIVKGQVVQSKNIGKDIGAGLKTIGGGELVGYSDMLKEARQIATKRMDDEAESLRLLIFVLVRLLLCLGQLKSLPMERL